MATGVRLFLRAKVGHPRGTHSEPSGIDSGSERLPSDVNFLINKSTFSVLTNCHIILQAFSFAHSI
jgi:hypothetical protein